jgi:glycosyltransferase involved in cell wall biosynthesis
MKISIVTISFNQRAYLKEAMDSVLEQGYPELEYIVVDPGSTDGSRDLIQSYADRISKVIFEPDRGAADGLNKGFAAATGEVYGFLNSDDLLMPGSLQTVADFFHEHPDCDFMMGGGHKIDRNGNPYHSVRARDFTVRRFCYAATRWLQQSTFFRREVFLRSPGFNIDNRTSWDGELFVTMINQGARVGYISSDLSAFRIHQKSITGSQRMQEEYNRDRWRMFKLFMGHDFGPADRILLILYKIEGILIRVGEIVNRQMQNSKKRVEMIRN